MTDYTEVNEKYQQFIDENKLGELFKYTGEGDSWEYVGSYPSVRFSVHNKPRTIEWCIKIAYLCGCKNERQAQIEMSVNAFRNLITPSSYRDIYL